MSQQTSYNVAYYKERSFLTGISETHENIKFLPSLTGCTQGAEVINTATRTDILNSGNVQAGLITVESGKCFNQIAVNISDIGAATAYQVGVYDDVSGTITNLLAVSDNDLVPINGEFKYIDVAEFTAPSDTLWIACQSNSDMTWNTMSDSDPRRRDVNTFGTFPDPFVVAAEQSTPAASKIRHS